MKNSWKIAYWTMVAIASGILLIGETVDLPLIQSTRIVTILSIALLVEIIAIIGMIALWKDEKWLSITIGLINFLGIGILLYGK